MTNVVPMTTREETPLAIARDAAEIVGLAIRLRMRIYQHPAGSPLPDDIMDAAYEALHALIKAAEEIGDIT